MTIPTVPPFVRPPLLCCIMNPSFLCEECKAPICEACNNVDLEYGEGNGISVELIGHNDPRCLTLNTPSDASIWEIL